MIVHTGTLGIVVKPANNTKIPISKIPRQRQKTKPTTRSLPDKPVLTTSDEIVKLISAPINHTTMKIIKKPTTKRIVGEWIYCVK